MTAPGTRPEAQPGAFSMSAYDDLWRCRYCRRHFVVPVLARDHERECPDREA